MPGVCLAQLGIAYCRHWDLTHLLTGFLYGHSRIAGRGPHDHRHHRDRRASTKVVPAERLDPGKQGQGQGFRSYLPPACRHHHDDVEGIPGPDEVQDQGDHDRRTHLGQSDMPEALQHVGSVDFGCLVKLRRNALHTRKQHQCHERKAAPDRDYDQGPDVGIRVAHPNRVGVVDQPEPK